jgi:hypothetical protein
VKCHILCGGPVLGLSHTLVETLGKLLLEGYPKGDRRLGLHCKSAIPGSNPGGAYFATRFMLLLTPWKSREPVEVKDPDRLPVLHQRVIEGPSV